VTGCGGAQARKATHLGKGQTFLAEGNFEKARVEFRNALQIAPTDSEARYFNGVADEKLGNPREAAQFYQGAIDTNTDNVAARAALGRLYLFAAVPEKALDTVKPAIIKHPDDADLLTVRAAAETQLKSPEAALADAERAIKLAPTNENVIAVLAGIYRSTDQVDKAEALLLGGIKKLPKTVDLRLILVQLYGSTGNAIRVEELLTELVRLNPQDVAHRLRLAQYYARTNQLDHAESTLRDGIAALPKERELKTSLIDVVAARRGREAAEKELNGFIAQDPKDYPLKFALGLFYQQGKEYSKAEANYKGVIDAAGLEAAGITARNKFAVLRIEQGDIPGAEKLIAEVLAKSPRDNDALIMRGNLALAKQDPKTAIADLRAVLRDQPNTVGVMRSLARAHLANGEPALAEETMRRAVDANPSDPEARLDLAQLLIQLGKPAQAAPVVSELIKQQPNNLQALDAQFKIAVAGKDYALAKTTAESIAAAQPKSPLGYYYQGAVAESEKRSDTALRFYSTAFDLRPDSLEPLEAITRVLLANKRAPEALKRVEQSIARSPKSAPPVNLKGEILLMTERRAEAVETFRAAEALDPTWWAPYRNLAIAQKLQHDNDAAAKALQEGIVKVKTPAILETELAALYEQSGKPDAAMQVYEEALKRDPSSAVAANNLAMLLVSVNKDPRSLDRAKQLAARFANSPNAAYLDTYGWVLYKRGERSAAVTALQSALSKNPDSPMSLYHLGMAQALAGQSSPARDNLERSLKSGKKFPGMDEAQATLDQLAKAAPSIAATPKS
jgi:tetratricopeptide (TPR) repeat protein